MDVMLGYCFVHTCKGPVELAISLLSIDHVMLGYCFVYTCKGLVELAISFPSIDHGCHVGILLCAFMQRGGRVSNILTGH